jgi:proton-coupled amino acid transporter
VVVIALYTSVGFLGESFVEHLILLINLIWTLGYLKYGDSVEASITLSLPNEPLYESVQLMYAIAITFSYPLQLYVAIHLIWPFIEKKLQESKTTNITIYISDYLFRAFLVTITCK